MNNVEHSLDQALKSTIISQQDGYITFVIDADLPKPRGHMYYASKAINIAKRAIQDGRMTEAVPEILATSFGDTKLFDVGRDVCYQTFVRAYAEHRPLVITPDMMWLLICQGYSYHVNLDPEKYRDLLVSHSGKLDIIVRRDTSGHYEQEDVELIVSEFSKQVTEYTKGTIASDLVASFSTTGPLERLVSQITLMDVVKEYFEFIHMEGICGIPYIKLKGTPEDWESILERIHQFDQFGLEWWTAKLDPILKEFVEAAKGNPKAAFWKGIVKKYRPGMLIGRGCIPEGPEPTIIDGWILNFFPYCKDGRTPDKVINDESLLPETVSVPFIHRIVDDNGALQQEERLEFTAGFFGVHEDRNTFELTPVMGWAISKAESNQDILNALGKEASRYGLSMRISKVPEALRSFKRIESLELRFAGPVELPSWLDEIDIDRITIRGKLTEDEQKSIEKRFKRVFFDCD